jgi:hypothetical protein
MTVEVVPHNGHVICRDGDVRMTYIGYTKKQAERAFRKHLRDLRRNAILKPH